MRVDGSISDACTFEPIARSWPHRHSVIVVTAAFVVAYTALFDSGANVPFDDDVFITWPVVLLEQHRHERVDAVDHADTR